MSASPTVFFVSGCSRGIGLEIVRQLALSSEARVVAAARDPKASAGLMDIVKASEGKVEVVALDITSEQSIAQAVEATLAIPFVQSNASSIDQLFLVAGTMSSGWKPATQVTAVELRTDAGTNYIGSILLTLALLPVLQQSPKKEHAAKVVYLSTLLASTSLLPSLGPHATVAASYASSKIAANLWFRKLALEIQSGLAGVGRDGGWCIGMIHPGLVSTDMTRFKGEIGVEESVQGVLSVAAGLKEKDTGTFWDWKGGKLTF